MTPGLFRQLIDDFIFEREMCYRSLKASSKELVIDGIFRLEVNWIFKKQAG